MNGRDLALRELKRVVRVRARGEDVSDVEIVDDARRALEAALDLWESAACGVDPEDAEDARQRVPFFREALSLLVIDKKALLDQARAETVVEASGLVEKRGREILERLRRMQADDLWRATLEGLGYRGSVPSLAYAMAVQEIIQAGGRVEGPHSELPESG